MPVDLTLRIVLTGLISVVAHDGGEYALVLDAQHHQAVLLLAEGSCVDSADCEDTYLKPHFWPVWTSGGLAESVPISVHLGTSSPAPARRRLIGVRPPMPDEHVYLAPVEWSASLCEAYDPNETSKECELLHDAVEKQGRLPDTCLNGQNCGLSAILTLPGGLISACHFNHIRSYERPPPSSVACREEWPSSGTIQPTHIVAARLGNSGDRAVADSLVAEVVVRRDRGRPIQLRIGEKTVKIRGDQTGGSDERITLLLMNEERADFCDLECERCKGKCSSPESTECQTCLGGCECGDVASDEHHHFQSYYTHLLGLESGPRLVMYPENGTGWADAGACEMLFTCMEAKGHERLDQRLWEARDGQQYEEKEIRFQVPHSPSQCDVSTYP